MIRNIKTATIILLVLSAIGFVDATYLTVLHFQGGIPPCTLSGCEIVLTSDSNQVFGIPVALLGSLYYLTILILAIIQHFNKSDSLLIYISYFTIIGFIFTLFLLYTMIFVIHSLCQYCLISALTSTLLCASGVYIVIKEYRLKSISNRNILNS